MFPCFNFESLYVWCAMLVEMKADKKVGGGGPCGLGMNIVGLLNRSR